MFPEEALKVFAALEKARRNNSSAEVHLNAHTLKGMLRMFEARTAADAAYELEQAGKKGGIGTDSEVETLHRELAATVAAVQRLQASLSQ